MKPLSSPLKKVTVLLLASLAMSSVSFASSDTSARDQAIIKISGEIAVQEADLHRLDGQLTELENGLNRAQYDRNKVALISVSIDAAGLLYIKKIANKSGGDEMGRTVAVVFGTLITVGAEGLVFALKEADVIGAKIRVSKMRKQCDAAQKSLDAKKQRLQDLKT